MSKVLLVHGGLWGEISAERFWSATGVMAALAARGLRVAAPERLAQPADWGADAAHLAPHLTGPGWTVVGGSNGCAVAARLAVDHPDLVDRLLLAWPATAGDPALDSRLLDGIGEPIRPLLAGGVLRGVADGELAGLRIPVGVLPSLPHNPVHQRRTVDGLLELIPGAVELPGSPEAPRPEFPAHLDAFAEVVAAFSRGGASTTR